MPIKHLDAFTKRHLLAWCKSFFFAEEVDSQHQHIWNFLKTIDNDDERGYLISMGWPTVYRHYCNEIAY